MNWESVPECEAEESTEAPIYQDDQSRHSWQNAEKIGIRKLLREFGKSSAVKRVAEEHLLIGKCYSKSHEMPSVSFFSWSMLGSWG